ncbi:holo-ACP synthase [Carboxydothermus pertinax]|uniref:Holo-[acyl-carrier-protein] synthase n=1 Tax=Carboxydothermus pertinax TaxID=870242 RepID=A0A1L8CSK0_9THEO|nr:holo-ACP synthase [Carboxydothermus pertinax]GAV21900.1 holo-ACP synthase [Carboxydothermus pertinax]
MFSTGIDLVDVLRIKKLHQRFGERFLHKIYTAKELEYAFSLKDPYLRLATRFAAKEAAAKALGTGIGAVNFKDIEVVSGQNGPELLLHRFAAEIFQEKGFTGKSLSLSHEKKVAVAICIMWRG